jgi:hypothetical protein
MATSIPVPESAYKTIIIALNDESYDLTFRFNEADERWRVTIEKEGTVIFEGLKIVEEQWLLAQYHLPLFNHGSLYCKRIYDDGLPVGRSNLGLGKPYELIYFSKEEIAGQLDG